MDTWVILSEQSRCLLLSLSGEGKEHQELLQALVETITMMLLELFLLCSPQQLPAPFP